MCHMYETELHIYDLAAVKLTEYIETVVDTNSDYITTNDILHAHVS